jgi:hypothetical protein
MATTYAYADNTAWVDTGRTGPCTIEAGGPEVQLHFGTVLPADYEAGPHHHLFQDDIPFYYSGTESVYIRAHNNNVAGVTQRCKAIITDG